MKTRKIIHEMSNGINTNQLDVTNLQFSKIFCLPIWVAVVMSISLVFVTKSVRAENTGTEEVHPNYRYIPYKGPANTTDTASQGTKESSAAKDTEAKKTDLGEQIKKPNEEAPSATTNVSTKESSTEKCAGVEKTTSGDQKSQTDPVSKPADGKGALPTFAQADVNGDHYVTKDELQNFPYLLQVFDKVDAGKDGKLEQHEYQNLEMETKREGEIE